MNEFITNWGILCGVFLIALMSPGPDFVMAIRNAIHHGRRSGILTAAGFAAGVAVHTTYCLLGLATLIAQSILLFNVFKWVGAAYLVYIGILSLLSKGFDEAPENVAATSPILSDMAAFRSGFITNLFNPKATLFFMALFTQILHPGAPLWAGVAYGLTCFVMTFLWFSLVATVLTTPTIKAKFLRASQWINRLCGAALVALGIRLALAKVAQS